MDHQPSFYHAYLLRLSRVGQEQTFCCALYHSDTGQKTTFKDLDELYDFLKQREAEKVNLSQSYMIG